MDFLHAESVVGHGDHQPFLGGDQRDADVARPHFALDAVNDRILHDGLQRDFRETALINVFPVILIALDTQMNPRAKPVLLDGIVILYVFEFILHCDKLIDIGYGITKKSGQCLGHVGHIVKTCRNGLSADAFQRVVKEMGVNLILQRQILSLLLAGGDELMGVQHRFQRLQRFLHTAGRRMAQIVNILHGVAGHEEDKKPLHFLIWLVDMAVSPV